MELATTYLGMVLRNPLVASASPLSQTVAGVQLLADAGVGAVVLPSLFEEQLRREAEQTARLADAGTESFAESLSYLPPEPEDAQASRRYLSLVRRATKAVDIPVIASLNGVTAAGWIDYASAIQDAGAAAIELNVYYLPSNPHASGRDVEQRHVDILRRVRSAVSIPVAVKLGPYFSSTAEVARRLDEAGADGLVLFNRLMQPDIDAETLTVTATVPLSSPVEARLPRAWIALLRGRIRASLAATTGVAGPADVATYLLAGADDRRGVAAQRAGVRDGTARRAGGLDAAQGFRVGRRVPRAAAGVGRARRVPHRDDDGTRGLRPYPLTRCWLQNEVRSVEPAAAWAAFLNAPTVDTPNRCACAYDDISFVIAVVPISRRRSCSVHLPNP